MSKRLVSIAKAIDEKSNAAGEKGDIGQQLNEDARLLKELQSFWEDTPKQLKCILSITDNKIYKSLKEPKSRYQPLDNSLLKIIWGWGDRPKDFFDGLGNGSSVVTHHVTIKPLDPFFSTVFRLQQQMVIDDIRWRIYLSCLATLLQRLLPEGIRLSRHEEIFQHLTKSNLVSPETLRLLLPRLSDLFLAGKRYNIIIEICGEGSLVYIPQLTRPTWEKFTPLEPERAAAVLGPVQQAVRCKAKEPWKEDRPNNPRNANDIIKSLFEYFQQISRQSLAVVLYGQEQGTRRRRPARTTTKNRVHKPRDTGVGAKSPHARTRRRQPSPMGIVGEDSSVPEPATESQDASSGTQASPFEESMRQSSQLSASNQTGARCPGPNLVPQCNLGPSLDSSHAIGYPEASWHPSERSGENTQFSFEASNVAHQPAAGLDPAAQEMPGPNLTEALYRGMPTGPSGHPEPLHFTDTYGQQPADFDTNNYYQSIFYISLNENQI